ncbi:MAG: flavin reductase family protein [Paracoccaceae bacterium]
MAQSFVPGPSTERSFRDALGCFSSGVTVVTTMTADGPVGMTANSFSSVSLAPPLILWSAAKAPRRYRAFFAAERFAVHVLARNQQQFARNFATAGDAFEQAEWAPNDDGVPILAERLALFDCKTSARYDAGDHTIIVGQVLLAEHGSGAGLIFEQGEYGHFTPFKVAKPTLNSA